MRMKVIKRDGRAVDYDRTKIQIAIEKANGEVTDSNRASKEDIKGIISYIESLNKKRILVPPSSEKFTAIKVRWPGYSTLVTIL